MSEKLRDYYFKVSENLRAHDRGDEAREEALLAELDHLWLEMTPEEAEQSDVVGRFAFAMHEGDLAQAVELYAQNQVLHQLMAAPTYPVRTVAGSGRKAIAVEIGNFGVVMHSSVRATSTAARGAISSATRQYLVPGAAGNVGRITQRPYPDYTAAFMQELHA